MIIYTSISIILWNGIILLFAFKVQQNWREILQVLQIYNKVVLAAVALIVVVWLLKMVRGKSVNG
jgi:membrane protein DedA with SNARE-associated domain